MSGITIIRVFVEEESEEYPVQEGFGRDYHEPRSNAGWRPVPSDIEQLQEIFVSNDPEDMVVADKICRFYMDDYDDVRDLIASGRYADAIHFVFGIWDGKFS